LPPDLLIIYESEAEQWASYMRSVLSGPVAEEGICCYDVAAVTGRKSQEDFLGLVGYRCKLLILTKGLLESLCPLKRFFLARVLRPAQQVVVLLCGVTSIAALLEQVPLQGDGYLEISSEQEAHEYSDAVADIVRRGVTTDLIDLYLRPDGSNVKRASGELEKRLEKRLEKSLSGGGVPGPETRLEKRLSGGAAGAAKAPLLVVPSRVSCEGPGEVFLLLQECVCSREAEVEFTAGKQRVRVKTNSNWNDYTLSVTVPVGVVLYVSGVVKGRGQVQCYSSLGEMARLLETAADPVEFMCQALQVRSVEELDETLAGSLMQKMPTGGLTQLYWDTHTPASSTTSREDTPTLLHFVAQYGLRGVGSVLLQCPGAGRALRTPNRHGHTPLELAHTHGHTELHTLLQTALNVQDSEEGEDSSVYEMMSTAGAPLPKPLLGDPQVEGAGLNQEEDEEEEDPYAPLGVNDEEYDTILSSSSSVVIANRPPAPTPRPETIPTREDRTPFIAQVFQKKGPQSDAGTLYSLPLKRDSISSTYDTFGGATPPVPPHNPPPGLDELIDLQQQVKLGVLSVDEALDRFSQWQRLQRGVDATQQEKLRQLRASIINNREDDDSVYDKINIIHHTPNVAVKDCRRGSQPADTDFYSKPLKGQTVMFQKKGPQSDAGTLYSLPLKRDSISSTYDTFGGATPPVPPHNPPPGLDELIDLQQQVKLGVLSVDEALDRFSQWQRLQRGVDATQQEKLRQLRASIINNREDDDSVYGEEASSAEP
ncbi:B-cell scaffold protein with ankyrin repeats-like, partial [Engraulis encrasicolus]|uniref:B-cell scaffold protein with ankyrin repeats-like n=1 Tax=Engraulis encrasicolus TaxID=184585 RepID=UPI002FCF5486